MVVRPLFITSFMLADFLQDNAYFGARQLVVSSASSKTAYGTAFCLQGERDMSWCALTSERNAALSTASVVIGRRTTYDALRDRFGATCPRCSRLFGDESLRERVHHHFGDALVYDCFAGSAQNTNFMRDTGPPGPSPKFFFAPVQIMKRNAAWDTRCSIRISTSAARLRRAHRRPRTAVDEACRKQGLCSGARTDPPSCMQTAPIRGRDTWWCWGTESLADGPRIRPFFSCLVARRATGSTVLPKLIRHLGSPAPRDMRR